MNLTENNKPIIMGILNVTPDSFSDGGRFNKIDAALNQVEAMLKDGADIIDVGGESTRPGSDPVPPEEQIRRTIPVISKIRNRYGNNVVLSIDTTSSQVAEAALNAGADIINDVSGGLNDENILKLAAEAKVPIILMHNKGKPKVMQETPHYDDVMREVLAFLSERIELALKVGVAHHQIIVDPGIGFGKRKQDNLELLANLTHIVGLGYPVLLGASRKRFMGSILSVNVPTELVIATTVTSALGVMAGVKLFRVHDVKANRQAVEVAWAIKQYL